MPHRSGSSSSMTDNHLFTLQSMQQQFERLNMVLGDVRNRIDHRDTSIRNLQRGRFVPSTPWRAELPKEGNSTLASSTTWRTELPNLASSTTWRTELPKVQKTETSSKPKVELQASRNRDIKCVGACHITSQFPKQQVMNMQVNGEVETKNESVQNNKSTQGIKHNKSESGIEQERKSESKNESEIELKNSEREKEIEQEKERASEDEQQKSREVAENKSVEPREQKEKESSLKETNQSIPSLAISWLQKFDKEKTNELPPIRSIKHRVETVPGVAFPNQPAYRSTLEETFPYVIHCKQGKEDIVVDALSQRYVFLTSMSNKMLGIEYVKDPYANDTNLFSVYMACDTASVGTFYKHDLNNLFKETQLCVPSCSTQELLVHEAHSGDLMGHFCVKQVLDILSKHFFWPMKRDDNHICGRKAKSNILPHRLYTPFTVPSEPRVNIATDFVLGLPSTKRGRHYDFADVNRFSGKDCLPFIEFASNRSMHPTIFWHTNTHICRRYITCPKANSTVLLHGFYTPLPVKLWVDISTGFVVGLPIAKQEKRRVIFELGEYSDFATFNTSYLSPFDVGKDSRSNPFEERGDDVILVGCPRRMTKVGCPIDEKQSGLSNGQGSLAKGAAIYLDKLAKAQYSKMGFKISLDSINASLEDMDMGCYY